jgi:hypothetical protein
MDPVLDLDFLRTIVSVEIGSTPVVQRDDRGDGFPPSLDEVRGKSRE